MAKPVLHNPHLEGEAFFWHAGSPGILLIHGLTATTSEVRPLARCLHREGFSVSGLLLPGHGTQPSDLNRCRWKDWVESVEAAYKELSRTCRKVVVGGESMGAVLASWLAAAHPEIGGLLLYAPAISVPQLRWALWLSWLLPYGPKKKGKNFLPWQGYTVWPLKAARQFYLLQTEVVRRLPQICQPALIVQGSLDRTIHPASGRMIFQSIASPCKEYHEMEHSAHCVLLDRELDEISKLTVRFFHRASLQPVEDIP